ncbi:MAG: MFS transporter [Pseudomonadota bacterium]
MGKLSFHLSSLQCFCAGSLYAWSAMIPALRETYAVEVEQAGLVFSISILAFTVAVLAVARPPFPPRGVRTGAGFCLVSALLLSAAAYAPTFLVFVMLYGVGFGFCSGAIYLNCLDAAAKQDPKKVNVLTGYMVASFGVGGALFGPILRWLVAEGWGLSALLVPAVALFCIFLFSLIIAKGTTGEADRPPATVSGQPSKVLALTLVWFGFAFASAAGLMILGLASAFIEQAGGSVALSGVGLTAVALANTAGRLGAGLLTNWLALRRLAMMAALLSLAGIAATAWADGAVGTVIGVTVIAGSYGLVASTYPILTRSIFGVDGFSRSYSIVFTAWGLAGLTSPWAAGYLFDRTGSFDGALAVAAAAALMSLFAALLIARRLLPGP